MKNSLQVFDKYLIYDIVLIRVLLVIVLIISFLDIVIVYRKVFKIMESLNKNFGGYYFNILPSNSDFVRVISTLKKNNSELTVLERRKLMHFIVSGVIGTLCVILLFITCFVSE